MEPKRNFIRTLSISGVIIVVLIGGVWYMKSRIDEKFLVIEQKQVSVRANEKSLATLAMLQGNAEKAKQYLPQIDRMLTTRDQLLSFSTDISFLAQQAGFAGSPKFKEETAPQTGDLRKTNFSLSLEGVKNVDGLGNFFRLVEQSKYYVRFDTIDVTREGGNLRATLNGYVISF